MYLASYTFEGDPADIMSGYQQLLGHFPPETMDLHVCIRSDTGITVLDACPDQQTFEGFSRSPEFLDVVRSCGLPEPKATGLGDVHYARLRAPVTP